MFIPFVVPGLALYVLAVLLPLLQTVAFSFTDWRGVTPPKFAGVENYRHVFTDPTFWSSLRHTLAFTALGYVLTFGFGLFFAWSLTYRFRGKHVVRAIIFLPCLFSVLVAALLWKFIYHPTLGPLNALLSKVGLDSLALTWLGDVRTAVPAVCLAWVWQSLGLWVLLISAGLERIPPELYEAARVDGASEWAVFRHVTIPLVWEILRVLTVLWLIQALQQFAFVFVMTKGGPAGVTEVVTTYIYGVAFQSRNYGYGMALATSMMLVILAVTLVVNRLARKESVEF